MLYGHVLAPNPAFAKSGAGSILAEFTVISALQQGFSGIDLLAPADPYKCESTMTMDRVADYQIAKTLAGVLFAKLWLGWGREAAKRLATRIRMTTKHASS